MRIDVKKFLFIGIDEDRKIFFKRAQEIGIIHFIELPNKSKEMPSSIEDVTKAIKILRGLPTMPQEHLGAFSLADGLVHKILQLQHSLDKLAEEQRIVRLDIARVGMFGHFSMDDIEYIEREGKKKIQFFFGKHGVDAEGKLPSEVIYVTSDHGLDYFVSISDEPKQYENLVEMRIDAPLGELESRQVQIEREIHETEQRLKSYSKYNTFLHRTLIHKLNGYHLQTAELDATSTFDNTLFSIEGWVPEDKVKAVQHLVNEMNVYMSEIAVEPHDVPPTYLENEGLSRIGEDLIGIYDTPSNKDKDPSLWVLGFFAFFFAFIVYDAGYGLIFLAAALYFWYKYPTIHGAKRRVLKLFTILSIASIVWGILTASFFGIEISPDSPLQKVSILHWLATKKVAYMIQHHDENYDYWVKKFPDLKDVTDPETFINKATIVEPNGKVKHELLSKFSDSFLLELALLIGIIHIIISLLRYIKTNWQNIGWIAVIIGCYLYFPSYLHTTTILDYLFDVNRETMATQGIYLIFGGLATAVILSLIRHKWHGLEEFMNAIRLFGDILSYLRLYALGLAGAIVTATINESAFALSFVVWIFLAIFGHIINMTLAIMGGIIHGLRLNFLEWYHWSFYGGGKPFKPLRKVEIE